MFHQPRITPHEVVKHEGDSPSHSVDLELEEYGEVYEPQSTRRVSESPVIQPAGHPAYGPGNREADAHGEQPYYSQDTIATPGKAKY